MMFLGGALFILFFVLMTPQCQAFLHVTAVSTSTFIGEWAPVSYILLAIIVAGPFAAMYVVHTWPQRVEPENPMAKYRREQPSVDDD